MSEWRPCVRVEWRQCVWYSQSIKIIINKQILNGKDIHVQTAEQSHKCVNGWNQAERELEHDLCWTQIQVSHEHQWRGSNTCSSFDWAVDHVLRSGEEVNEYVNMTSAGDNPSFRQNKARGLIKNWICFFWVQMNHSSPVGIRRMLHLNGLFSLVHVFVFEVMDTGILNLFSISRVFLCLFSPRAFGFLHFNVFIQIIPVIGWY